jgi:uncharacterized protein DUF3152
MQKISILLGGLLILTSSVISLTQAVYAADECNQKATICNVTSALELTSALSSVSNPTITTPSWMQVVATNPQKVNGVITVSYSVETRGAITSDMGEFRRLANETLNDSRGWSRMGVQFAEVSTGGSFTLVLARPDDIGALAGCGSEYSCRSGRYVMINEERWNFATPAWNSVGGSLRDYRNMVVNHETGHWLGHDHSHCSGAGQPAEVMQQQSISLEGCTFNPWPNASELWSTMLGIRL